MFYFLCKVIGALTVKLLDIAWTDDAKGVTMFNKDCTVPQLCIQPLYLGI